MISHEDLRLLANKSVCVRWYSSGCSPYTWQSSCTRWSSSLGDLPPPGGPPPPDPEGPPGRHPLDIPGAYDVNAMLVLLICTGAVIVVVMSLDGSGIDSANAAILVSSLSFGGHMIIFSGSSVGLLGSLLYNLLVVVAVVKGQMEESPLVLFHSIPVVVAMQG